MSWRLPRPPAEASVAVACAIACAVPLLRLPAGFMLLCLLPGLALCRHRLGEPSLTRGLLLGGIFSLCLIPLVTIPLSLLAGRPARPLTILCAVAVTLAACRWRPVLDPPAGDSSRLPAPGRSLAIVLVLALAMQIGATLAIHPDADSIRWRGTPDHYFFQGIYSQTAWRTPPLDPENGTALLIHNWIYHFHFSQVGEVTGLSNTAMQRLVSAWLGVTLLGVACLIAADLFRRPAAGLITALFLLTSGEIRWLTHALKTGSLEWVSLGWRFTPFGVLLLFGWYNLAPIATLMVAWYAFERHRANGRPAWLAASLLCFTAAAFFHPVLYGSFMAGFLAYVAWLFLKGERSPKRLGLLLTPVPFFLFYALPYYGFSAPPQVVEVEPALAAMAERAWTLLLYCGALLPAAAGALLVLRGGCGSLAFLIGIPAFLSLILWVPNPHWLYAPFYLATAIAAGIGLERLWTARRGLALPLILAALAPGLVAFALHLRVATSGGHTFSPDEKAAAAWLKLNSDRDALVAALPNSAASYPILSLAERRMVHGWTTHLLDFLHDAREREDHVREMLLTPDPARAEELAREKRVAYVWLGPETARAVPGAGLEGGCFPVAFQSPGVTLRAFTCGQAAPAR